MRHWPWLAAAGGGWMVLESLHGPLSSLMGLGAAGAGLWLLGGRMRPSGQHLPQSSEGWLERCEAVLEQFQVLQAASAEEGRAQAKTFELHQTQRRSQLELLRQRQEETCIQLALVGTAAWSASEQEQLLCHCPSVHPLRVHRSHALPLSPQSWQWPEVFRHCELLLYRLDLPLTAADLRWLEALPEQQRVGILVRTKPELESSAQLQQLEQQLPVHLRGRCWPLAAQEASGWRDLTSWFAESTPLSRERNQQRCLQELHAAWQLELEGLRRQHWSRLLQRTQWTVAAGVVVAPLPSLDLLVLAAANGLMLQEMARLWNCPWSLEQLQASASQLGKAALSLGVVEWSSQALASVVKWHGPTWLVGGAMQALSAAYLTRVVGRAMADYMALAAGVPEAELDALLQRQAPLLVARAADEEKLDWSAFLVSAQQWLKEQSAPA
ncbi:MAG: DUF697 domain-containing protein [Vulcanococcus sp.]|jgi:uncharacterized protein (DUF697 family)